MDETVRQPVPVDLALQGGGSHGAFTWGNRWPRLNRNFTRLSKPHAIKLPNQDSILMPP